MNAKRLLDKFWSWSHICKTRLTWLTLMAVGAYFAETHHLDHLGWVKCINNKGISSALSVTWIQLDVPGVNLSPEFKKPGFHPEVFHQHKSGLNDTRINSTSWANHASTFQLQVWGFQCTCAALCWGWKGAHFTSDAKTREEKHICSSKITTWKSTA